MCVRVQCFNLNSHIRHYYWISGQKVANFVAIKWLADGLLRATEMSRGRRGRVCSALATRGPIRFGPNVQVHSSSPFCFYPLSMWYFKITPLPLTSAIRAIDHKNKMPGDKGVIDRAQIFANFNCLLATNFLMKIECEEFFMQIHSLLNAEERETSLLNTRPNSCTG